MPVNYTLFEKGTVCIFAKFILSVPAYHLYLHKHETTTPFTRAKKIGTARQIFGTVPRLPVPRLPPGGSLGTPKILSTGATLHVGPIRLYVENWERRALKSSARCQKFAVPCRFF